MSNGKPLALVTGASSGIGATFARHLARRGYSLILVARRAERLAELARELSGAEVIAADLTRDQDLPRVEQRAADVDFLVNNAGFGTRGLYFDAPLETQDAMHRLHVLATVRLTHAALRGMTARRRGAIVNVASVAGFMQSPGSISYCSTKAWMNSFTEGLYIELKAAGIPVCVQALCPGYTYTEFHDVAKIDRNLVPKNWWMDADTVVADSLRGVDNGRLFVVPGWRYKLIVCLFGAIPRSLARAITLVASRRFKRV